MDIQYVDASNVKPALALKIASFLRAQFTARPDTGGDLTHWEDAKALANLQGNLRVLLGIEAGKIRGLISWVEAKDLEGPLWQISAGIGDFTDPMKMLDPVAIAFGEMAEKAGIKRYDSEQPLGTPGAVYMKGLGCHNEESPKGRERLVGDIGESLLILRARQ